jgi:hypothetical protein
MLYEKYREIAIYYNTKILKYLDLSKHFQSTKQAVPSLLGLLA